MGKKWKKKLKQRQNEEFDNFIDDDFDVDVGGKNKPAAKSDVHSRLGLKKPIHLSKKQRKKQQQLQKAAALRNGSDVDMGLGVDVSQKNKYLPPSVHCLKNRSARQIIWSNFF